MELSNPSHGFRPERLLDFLELPQFRKRWNALGLDDERDLAALQMLIMLGPDKHPRLRGTNGIRKLRFSPTKWDKGKRGGVRVLYVYFKEFGIVLLSLVHAKNEAETISEPVKQYLNKLVLEAGKELQAKYHHFRRP